MHLVLISSLREIDIGALLKSNLGGWEMGA